jgi:glycosyltransferase involved in cell wall biosynthesis
VVIVSLVPPGGDKQELRLDENLLEIQIPQTRTFRLLARMLEKKAGISVEDIAAIRGFGKIPSFKQEISRQAGQADVLVASHPYLYFALAGCNKPVWYDAHNVEFDLKTGMLGSRGRKLAEAVFEVEKECAQASSFVLACSREDAARLQTLYGVDDRRLRIVPNGVDTGQVPFVDEATRMENKSGLGWEDVATCLFIGSLHQPNEQGLQALGDIAAGLPSILFLVAGSVCRSAHARGLPANVKLLDRVTEREKQVLLHGVDLGLNPIDTGSGTNLKLLEYAAAGLPALSTPFGTRGTDLTADHVFIAPLAEWVAVIPEVLRDESTLHKATRRARDLVQERFSWQAVGKKLLGDLDQMLGANVQQR